MSKLNLQFFLNTYSDTNASNAPSLQNFKWTRNINGLAASNPESLGFTLAPGETKVLFDGTRTLAQDNTTVYDLTLKPLSTNAYILNWNAGTKPAFRTARAIGVDATSQFTVTVNGPIATFTSSGGTAPVLTSVQVGDILRIGDIFNPGTLVFNQANNGLFKVIAKTSNSITVQAAAAVAEGPITLGASFADQFQIYSAAGVQVNDTIVFTGGFSAVTQARAYKIIDVAPEFVVLYSTDVLPQETAIQTMALSIYENAKKFVYLESSQNASLAINGTSQDSMTPFVSGTLVSPALYVRTATTWSLSVTNVSTSVASLFLACVE